MRDDPLNFTADDGVRSAPIPTECGRILSMCLYQDRLFLACENGVWTFDPKTDLFEKVKFKNTPDLT